MNHCGCAKDMCIHVVRWVLQTNIYSMASHLFYIFQSTLYDENNLQRVFCVLCVWKILYDVMYNSWRYKRQMQKLPHVHTNVRAVQTRQWKKRKNSNNNNNHLSCSQKIVLNMHEASPYMMGRNYFLFSIFRAMCARWKAQTIRMQQYQFVW